jgi:hypothetical protein
VYGPDRRCVNEQLLAAGYAWWYREYAKGDKAAESLEADARNNGRGLWADPSPVAPWEFRKGKREGYSTERATTSAPAQYSAPTQPSGSQSGGSQSGGGYYQGGGYGGQTSGYTAPAAPPASPSGGGDTVYVTQRGECFHRANCESQHHSVSPMSREAAVAAGYRPCSNCKP